MNNSIITLEGVVKRFGNNEVVKNLNLEVAEGEFLTLLGPSGCGKTTTLRMIAGFEEASEGIIKVEGERVEDKEPFQRNVNTVFQNYALFPHMTVFNNIAYGLTIKKVPKAEINERVTEMLRMVQMEPYAKRKPDELSGGQKQRVAIARALVNEPKVLLLDEPLAALDLKLRKEMQYELKRIQQEVGITFIFVTHDQEEALTMSDKIVVMNGGEIQQVGTPTDIYNEPQNSFVADFIGESNILNGTMIKDKLVEFVGHEFECIDEGFGENTPVDVVVRPEDIYIVRNLESAQFTATVKSWTFKGVHYEMFVDTDKGYELMIQDYNAFEPESEVGLIIRPADIQVMHKERTCNTFEGEIVDETHVKFLGETFECLPQSGFEAGEKVKVEVAFSKVDLIDHPEEGMLSGDVYFLLYKGDHYHLTIMTDDGDHIWVDTNDIWDKGDLVGINIAPQDIKIVK